MILSPATGFDLFTEKRVAIIGPAPYAYRQDLTPRLSGVDTVVRLNYAFDALEEAERTTTDRCDVLYTHTLVPWHSGWLTNRLRSIRLRRHIGWTDQIAAFHPLALRKVDLIQLEIEEHYGRHYESHPSTGILAISDVLSYSPLSLFVTGFTFYQKSGRESDIWLPGYDRRIDVDHAREVRETGNRIGDHNPGNDLDYFRRFLADRVEMDETISKLC